MVTVMVLSVSVDEVEMCTVKEVTLQLVIFADKLHSVTVCMLQTVHVFIIS
jgi:hypothetical protein